MPVTAAGKSKKEKRLCQPFFFFAELKNEIEGNYSFSEVDSGAVVSSPLISFWMKDPIVAISSVNHSISTCTAPGSISIKRDSFH